MYELVNLPKDISTGELKDSSTEGKRGTGHSALFVARNHFAVLDQTAQTIEIQDLLNTITKTMKCPQAGTQDMFYGGMASLLLSIATRVVLFDIMQQKVLAEIATPLVKYVVWSGDGGMVALLSKHSTCFSLFSSFLNACKDANPGVVLWISDCNCEYDKTLEQSC